MGGAKVHVRVYRGPLTLLHLEIHSQSEWETPRRQDQLHEAESKSFFQTALSSFPHKATTSHFSRSILKAVRDQGLGDSYNPYLGPGAWVCGIHDSSGLDAPWQAEVFGKQSLALRCTYKHQAGSSLSHVLEIDKLDT